VIETSRILDRARNGEPSAAGDLLPLVYGELRRLAAFKMAHEGGPQTLQPTALVHEAWLRLGGSGDQRWDSRTHFFAAAAEAMRRILIDRARRKLAVRHGGGQAAVALDEVEIAVAVPDEELLVVDEALEEFAARDKEKAELVKLRYFVGLTLEETADALGVSVPTASRWWAFSRAWLSDEIERRRGDRGAKPGETTTLRDR
jgi:RNA polymerase sigma factor (TIGR02999 family)